MKAETVIEFRKPVTVVQMACTVCGAQAEASCDCGAPYLPAGKKAAKGIAANPELSDRAIAEKLGIGNKTVSRVRKQAGVSGDTGEKRQGRDGKLYPAGDPQSPDDSFLEDGDEEDDPSFLDDDANYVPDDVEAPVSIRIKALLYRAGQSVHAAATFNLTGIPITDEIMDATVSKPSVLGFCAS
jgi:hypothetical protein